MSAVMYWPGASRRKSSRALNAAVLASLAFHGVLLFSVHLRSKSPPVLPGPIVAHLVTARAPVAPAAPTPEKPSVEQTAPSPPPPPPQARPAPQPRPAPVAKPHAPASKPAPTAPPSEPVAPTPPVPTAAAPSPAPSTLPSAPSSAPAIAKAAPAPAAAAPAEDAGSLDAYRIDLMRMARRYKRYPRVAMDNNWEGKVIVRMVIGANGLISSLSVVTSSGHEILDKQAVDMIQKSKPLVLIPAALRGREFKLEIPVIYSLKEPEAG